MVIRSARDRSMRSCKQTNMDQSFNRELVLHQSLMHAAKNMHLNYSNLCLKYLFCVQCRSLAEQFCF